MRRRFFLLSNPGAGVTRSTLVESVVDAVAAAPPSLSQRSIAVVCQAMSRGRLDSATMSRRIDEPRRYSIAGDRHLRAVRTARHLDASVELTAKRLDNART